MKNVKKLICVALMLALTVTLLCACGDDEKEKLPFIGTWEPYEGDYDELEEKYGGSFYEFWFENNIAFFEDGTCVVDHFFTYKWEYEDSILWILPTTENEKNAFIGKVSVKDDLLILNGFFTSETTYKSYHNLSFNNYPLSRVEY